MSFLNNFYLPVIQQFDLENKLIAPALHLYTQFVMQLKTLYQTASNTILDLAASSTQAYDHLVMKLKMFYQLTSKTFLDVAASSRQAYNHPGETLTAWYNSVNNSGSELMLSIKSQMIPKTYEYYQQSTATLTQISEKTQLGFQAFFSHPKQSADAVLQTLSHSVTVTAGKGATAAIDSYNTILNSFNSASEQLSAALQSMYKNTMASLLDTYVELISSTFFESLTTFLPSF